MGKSGLIARKISASLSSTGTPSFFLHPAEALHGDSGVLKKEDLLVVISNSGETEEIIELVSIARFQGLKIISITGNTSSTIAEKSDLVIPLKYEREADPYNMVATTSTLLTLAIGDALVVCLMKKRNFKEKDFALFHPGGTAGKKFLKVKDLMQTGENNPVVKEKDFFRDALYTITEKKLGAVSIVDEKGKITGIITDGDVRRLLQKTKDFLPKLFLTEVKDVMTKNPKIVFPEEFATEALKKMEDHNITVLPVVNKKMEPIGMIHLHTLIKAGFSLKKK
jgi:arabinose-5-phosphate isomerase